MAENAAGRSLGSIARRGAMSVGLAQAGKIVIQFLNVIVMSRLLEPEDFGLVASIAPVVAFVSLFQDIGLQQAVIQRESLTDRQLNQIFWVTVGLGAICTALVVSLGPAVVWFYGDSRLLDLTAALGAPLWVSSLGAVPMSLLSRRMQFGALASMDILGVALGFGAAVAGALNGLGYWSLALAPMITAFVNLVGNTIAARWKPGRPTLRLDREILGFGANITGFNLASFFARNLDNVLIGRFHGSLELGYYDRAYKLLMFPLQNLNWPMTRVMLPVLSRIQDDKPRLREVYLKTIGLLMVVEVPGIAALTVVPEAAIELCFGAKWLPVAPIFAWLGLASLLHPLNSSSNWLFIAQGKTRAMLRWGLFGSVTTIAAIGIGLNWGAVGVATAFAITDYLVRLPVLYWFMRRIGPVRVRDLIALQLPFLAAAATTKGIVDVWLLDRLQLESVPLIAATVAVSYGTASLFLALSPLGRRALGEVLGMAGKIVSRRRPVEA